MITIKPSDLKERADELLESLATGEAPFLVADNGTPRAVLLAVDEWERIQSVLAMLEERLDDGSLASLRRAMQDIELGRLSEHDGHTIIISQLRFPGMR